MAATAAAAAAPATPAPPAHLSITPEVATALAQVAAAVGTPAYVYDLATVRARCGALNDAVAASGGPGALPVQLLYAVKANPCRPVVEAIVGSGFGLEAVSVGEVTLALAAGAAHVLYTANNVSDDEFAAVVAAGASAGAGRVWINVDSLQRLSALPAGTEVFIRINGPVGGGHHDHVITCDPASKFGIPHEHLPAAIAAAAAAGVSIVGLHQHIGSGVLAAERYAAAVGVLAGVLASHGAALPALRYLDVGGGLGVPYRPEQTPLDVRAVVADARAQVAAALATLPPRPVPLTLVMEPGRFPVAEAGYLLATVNTLKPTPYGRTYAGVDTGFNHLVRPTMYGAYHHITNLTAAAAEAAGGQPRPRRPLYIAGNVCESGDVFTRGTPADIAPVHAAHAAAAAAAGSADEAAAASAAAAAAAAAALSGAHAAEDNIAIPRLLPDATAGDLLVFHTVGAYGAAMASEYNMRPRPAEVVLDRDGGGAVTLALARRAKTVAEMVAEAWVAPVPL